MRSGRPPVRGPSGRGGRFLEAGTSGGIWGLAEGYCLMVGGDEDAFRVVNPILATLAPPGGYAYVGPHGARPLGALPVRGRVGGRALDGRAVHRGGSSTPFHRPFPLHEVLLPAGQFLRDADAGRSAQRVRGACGKDGVCPAEEGEAEWLRRGKNRPRPPFPRRHQPPRSPPPRLSSLSWAAGGWSS